MNVFSNIWNHPTTSIAGLLIGIATIAGVLSAQGITLGSAGTGTVVTLIAGIASALLGLLAKDPGSGGSLPPASSGPQKLGALLLVALLLFPLAGCNAVSTSTPTAPTLTALNVLAQVQSNVLAIENSIIAAKNAGLIDAATAAKIGSALSQEALDATAVAVAIQSASATSTVQAKVDALLSDLQTDVGNGASGIKDAKTKATVIAAISVAEIAVNEIVLAYQANGN